VVCHPFRLNAEASWLSRKVPAEVGPQRLDCVPKYVLGCFRSILKGNGIPTFFINGERYDGMHDLKHLLDTLTAQSA